MLHVELLAPTPFVRRGRRAFSFRVINKGSSETRGIPYIVIRKPGEKQPCAFVIFDEHVIAPASETTFSAELDLSDVKGAVEIEAVFEVDGKIAASDKLPFYVYEEGPPIHVAFVWHFHQAPQYKPSGAYKDPWPFLHVYHGNFYSYSGGPYSVHVQLHRRVPRWKDVDHFSPSLLEQWARAVSEGFSTEREEVPPSDERVQAVAGVLGAVKELASEGAAELLGSVYAHTIMGFLLEEARKHGLERLLRFLLSWELEEGFRIVEEVLGRKPRGAWTPEMYWHMGLVGLLAKAGVEYTVLCEQHFREAGGDKGTIYEPYIVEDDEGNRVVVLFRDLQLSDWIGFHLDFASPEEAERAAWSFAVELARRRDTAPGGIVVIALDGENYMILPHYRPYAPYFVEKLAVLLAGAEVVQLTTLSEYLEKNPPKRVLKYVPKGSWIQLSSSQWVGGVKAETWSRVLQHLRAVAALLDALGEEQARSLLSRRQSPVYDVFKAAAISLDSDFYWYGEDERERSFVLEWAAYAEELALKLLSSVSLSVARLDQKLVEVEAANPTEFELRLVLLSHSSDRSLEVVLRPRGSQKLVLDAEGWRSFEVRAGDYVLTRC
uniref:Glycoside hydrolase family 57 N-terminal domain-containing protein n=2 Tax=Thermofilum pendens TaxID=2269 RepID=A0A7J3X8V4_THEPE